jgi:hypothetical protein
VHSNCQSKNFGIKRETAQLTVCIICELPSPQAPLAQPTEPVQAVLHSVTPQPAAAAAAAAPAAGGALSFSVVDGSSADAPAAWQTPPQWLQVRLRAAHLLFLLYVYKEKVQTLTGFQNISMNPGFCSCTSNVERVSSVLSSHLDLGPGTFNSSVFKPLSRLCIL